MYKIKYVKRKLFYKISYHPKHYKKVPVGCYLSDTKDKIIVWREEDYPEPYFYVTEDLLINECSYTINKNKKKPKRKKPFRRAKSSELIKKNKNNNFKEEIKDMIWGQIQLTKPELNNFYNRYRIYLNGKKLASSAIIHVIIWFEKFEYEMLGIRWCIHDYAHHLALISPTELIVVCPCGFFEVWELKTPRKMSMFELELGEICSACGLTDGLVALGFNDNTIKIMKIFDSKHSVSPTHLYSLYGQEALFLRYEKQSNILFTGGTDGSIKCYLIDSQLKGQCFLTIILDDKNLIKNKNDFHTYNERMINSISPYLLFEIYFF